LLIALPAQFRYGQPAGWRELPALVSGGGGLTHRGKQSEPWGRRGLFACALLLLSLCPFAGAQSGKRITLDEAIRLALLDSPAIKAARAQIEQNQAQEITANLRPNPTLEWDSQFLPLFQPSQFSADLINDTSQFDFGVGYLIERGKKRQHRLQAARDATAVTRAQVADAERNLSFNVAQQFIDVLLAESTLQFAQEALKSYQDTVGISEQRYRAGDMSEADLLKIKLQLLQFQTDVSSAHLASVQALQSLRQLIGFEAVPAGYDVEGELAYQPPKLNLDDLKLAALDHRPDLLAARRGITAAQSQHDLAQANGKVDLGTTFNYSHVSGLNTGAFFFNIPLPVFDRNQGEIARTRFAIGQAEFTSTAASETVLTDVSNAYEGVRSADEVVKLYVSGYLDQAKESRDINAYAYQHGAASLLDFLDAERSYRSTQLAYRQALASYLLAVEQLREAVGLRNLP
jgi:cobalt-zinc-cadmium efflux system outer membrane protein